MISGTFCTPVFDIHNALIIFSFLFAFVFGEKRFQHYCTFLCDSEPALVTRTSKKAFIYGLAVKLKTRARYSDEQGIT